MENAEYRLMISSRWTWFYMLCYVLMSFALASTLVANWPHEGPDIDTIVLAALTVLNLSISIALGLYLAKAWLSNDTLYIQRPLQNPEEYRLDQLSKIKVYTMRRLYIVVLTMDNDYGMQRKYMVLSPMAPVFSQNQEDALGKLRSRVAQNQNVR